MPLITIRLIEIFHLKIKRKIMERFTNIMLYENIAVLICEMMTLKFNPWNYSNTSILKTVIFYVASALSSQPIIE